MNGRMLLLAGYFGLIAVSSQVNWRQTPASSAASSPLDLEVNTSEDGSRISISVFNARASNILVNRSYRQAEALGDLQVRFFGEGRVFESIAEKYESPVEYQVDWLPAGGGIGWSLPKTFFAARYQLPRGCYLLEVKFSNQASVHASTSHSPGPAYAAAVVKRKVCI